MWKKLRDDLYENPILNPYEHISKQRKHAVLPKFEFLRYFIMMTHIQVVYFILYISVSQLLPWRNP
jgi:hypothetical protein